METRSITAMVITTITTATIAAIIAVVIRVVSFVIFLITTIQAVHLPATRIRLPTAVLRPAAVPAVPVQVHLVEAPHRLENSKI